MMLSPPPGARASPPELVQSWAGQQPAAATHVQGLSQDGEGQDEEEEEEEGEEDQEVAMSGSESESESPDGSSVMRAIELD